MLAICLACRTGWRYSCEQRRALARTYGLASLSPSRMSVWLIFTQAEGGERSLCLPREKGWIGLQKYSSPHPYQLGPKNSNSVTKRSGSPKMSQQFQQSSPFCSNQTGPHLYQRQAEGIRGYSHVNRGWEKQSQQGDQKKTKTHTRLQSLLNTKLEQNTWN